MKSSRSRIVTARLTPAVAERLRGYALASRRSVSAIIADLVATAMEAGR